jgi:uncharacterized paraquat-inducible protein A
MEILLIYCVCVVQVFASERPALPLIFIALIIVVYAFVVIKVLIYGLRRVLKFHQHRELLIARGLSLRTLLMIDLFFDKSGVALVAFYAIINLL